jgi:transposase
MEFRGLTDKEWGVISSFLPPKPKRGRRALSNERSSINGIPYVTTTGCRWREMLREYGSYTTAWRGLRRLQETGAWGKIMEFLKSMRRCERLAIDSTTVEAGGWRSGIRWIHRKGTKIHAVVEGSKPIAVALSPGNVHDSGIFNKLYDEVERKPREFYGDSAYDTCEVRSRLEMDGVQVDIPVNSRNGRRRMPYDEEGCRVMGSLWRGSMHVLELSGESW